jgi:hypothetical protein
LEVSLPGAPLCGWCGFYTHWSIDLFNFYKKKVNKSLSSTILGATI